LITSMTKVRPSVVFSAGLLFCVIMVILPELLPAFIGRLGYTWTPVHSQNYHLGDLYYYGAWLREAIATGIPVYSPTASELAGQPLIETVRSSGLILAALPGYIIPDIRWVIVFDYAFSAALFFSIAFFFAYAFTRNSWIGFGAGIAVLFMTDRLWVTIPTHVDSLNNIVGWVVSSCRGLVESIKYSLLFEEYDLYGSTFRFINISFSGPILLLYYLTVTLTYKRTDIKTIILLAAMSPLMAFTYPSHVIIAYCLLVAFSIIAIYRRNVTTSIAFVSIGAFTILVLEIIKYRQIMSDAFKNSQLWNNIFASEKLILLHNDIYYILAVIVLNKYLITWALMIYLSRHRQQIRDIVIATGIIAVPLSYVHLFDMPQLWARFLGRGIDHIWVMLLIVVLGDALYKTIINLQSSNEKYKPRRILYILMTRGVAFVSLAMLIIIPGIGFVHYAKCTSSNGSRFIPNATMEFYRWIDSTLPSKSEIASLDWEDITLLPIFTNANLVIGHTVIDGRNPTDELERFIFAWKFLGYNRLQLEQLIERGPEATHTLFQTTPNTHSPPYLSNLQFSESQFMMGILYWPYIKKIGGIQIVDGGEWGRISPAFKRYALEIFNRAVSGDFLWKYKVKYITMNSEQLALLGPPKNMRLLYRTETRSIFTP
jgi:hypothetical protein